MLGMVKILQMLVDAYKVKTSLGKLEGLLAPLVAFVLLGMFLTSLAALSAGVLLFSVFKGLIASGLNPLSSAILVTLILIAVFVGGVVAMYRLSRRLTGGMETAARTGRPLIGQVGHVAESFISGLMHSGASTVTRGPTR